MQALNYQDVGVYNEPIYDAAAGGDADLSAFEGHDLHVVKSNATLTFEHTYTWWGNKRVLRVLAEPNVTLSWSHVPLHCRRARTVILGPLMPKDIDCQSFVHKSRGKNSRGDKERELMPMIYHPNHAPHQVICSGVYQMLHPICTRLPSLRKVCRT